MGPRRLDEWEQARAAALQADIERMGDANEFIHNEAKLSVGAWGRDFSHTQAVREKMYEQSAGAMDAQRESFLGARADSSRAIAPDWVDLQLDSDLLDSRHDGPAGVVSIKRNTWTDDAGKSTFEAWDLDADPNGILPGTWTSTQSLARERVEGRPQ
jgi:hypothetical protein